MVRFTKESTFFDSANNEVLLLAEGWCLSSDTKPTANIATGSILAEVDTGDVYVCDDMKGKL